MLLPDIVDEPFDVYVNGVVQESGVDYEVRGRELWFHRELSREGKLGAMRWARMFLGVAGTYRRNDSVDVVYQNGPKRLVATGLSLVAPPSIVDEGSESA